MATGDVGSEQEVEQEILEASEDEFGDSDRLPEERKEIGDSSQLPEESKDGDRLEPPAQASQPDTVGVSSAPDAST